MSELTIEAVNMANYIWSIIRTQSSIAMSWGVDPDTIKAVLRKHDEYDEMGLSFHVQGFKHTGIVEVIYDEGADYFVVNLIPDDESKKRETIHDVCFDELVDIIDNHVEYTGDDYQKRVDKKYGL